MCTFAMCFSLAKYRGIVSGVWNFFRANKIDWDCENTFESRTASVKKIYGVFIPGWIFGLKWVPNFAMLMNELQRFYICIYYALPLFALSWLDRKHIRGYSLTKIVQYFSCNIFHYNPHPSPAIHFDQPIVIIQLFRNLFFLWCFILQVIVCSTYVHSIWKIFWSNTFYISFFQNKGTYTYTWITF